MTTEQESDTLLALQLLLESAKVLVRRLNDAPVEQGIASLQDRVEQAQGFPMQEFLERSERDPDTSMMAYADALADAGWTVIDVTIPDVEESKEPDPDERVDLGVWTGEEIIHAGRFSGQRWKDMPTEALIGAIPSPVHPSFQDARMSWFAKLETVRRAVADSDPVHICRMAVAAMSAETDPDLADAECSPDPDQPVYNPPKTEFQRQQIAGLAARKVAAAFDRKLESSDVPEALIKALGLK